MREYNVGTNAWVKTLEFCKSMYSLNASPSRKVRGVVKFHTVTLAEGCELREPFLYRIKNKNRLKAVTKYYTKGP